MRRLVLAAGVAAAACSPHKVTHTPAPPVRVPDGFGAQRSAPGAPGEALPEEWWTGFGDPRLDALVDQALADNLQLRAAWARVAQARALVAQANSGKFPQVELQASAARQEFQLPPQFRAFGGGANLTAQNVYSYSIGAGYELDLWKRVSNQAAGAALDAAAVRDDVGTIAITIAAEVTEAWLDLIAQTARRQLILDQLEINETYLELVTLRFQQGLASSLDVYQQRQQQVTTRAQLALIDAGLAATANRLALLIGQPPGAIAAQIEGLQAGQAGQPGQPGADDAAQPDAVPPAQPAPRIDLPALPPLPGTGIPADLLERRPDVRAARRRVEAADYRVAVAVADRLPALRLSGSLNRQETSVADFLARPVYNLIAGVTAPLFDGGRRKAEVTRNRAVVQERLAQYGQVLLLAMVEVESALVAERQQAIYIADLEQSLELARSTLREAQARYRQGLVDYLPVLAALQGTQQIELGLLSARRTLLSHRVQLCRALGGSWTAALERPRDLPLEPADREDNARTR